MSNFSLLLPLASQGCSSTAAKTPLDLYVLQPGSGPSDPNQVAVGKTWGDGQKWIVINDTADLVRHVKSSCGTAHYIRTLRIGGHGSSRGFYLGRDWIAMGTIRSEVARLREITPYLRPEESVVYLDHCNVGHDNRLMKRLSRILGDVAVIGPFQSQYTNAGRPQFEGPARICGPDFCKTTHTPNMSPERLVKFLKYGESRRRLPDPFGDVCE